MLGSSHAFSSFSTDNPEAAADFYGETLGLDVTVARDDAMGTMVNVRFRHGGRCLIYPKDDHVPASHTVLMFPVEDLDATVAALNAAGVPLEKTEWTDDNGVARDPEGRSPAVAWFKDPAGNWLSIIEESPDNIG